MGPVRFVMSVTSLVASTKSPDPPTTAHVAESVTKLRDPWRVAVEELQRSEGDEEIGVGMDGRGETEIVTEDEVVKEVQPV